MIMEKKIRNSNQIGLETSFPASLRPLRGLLSLISISVIAFVTSLGCSKMQLNSMYQSVSGPAVVRSY